MLVESRVRSIHAALGTAVTLRKCGLYADAYIAAQSAFMLSARYYLDRHRIPIPRCRTAASYIDLLSIVFSQAETLRLHDACRYSTLKSIDMLIAASREILPKDHDHSRELMTERVEIEEIEATAYNCVDAADELLSRVRSLQEAGAQTVEVSPMDMNGTNIAILALRRLAIAIFPKPDFDDVDQRSSLASVVELLLRAAATASAGNSYRREADAIALLAIQISEAYLGDKDTSLLREIILQKDITQKERFRRLMTESRSLLLKAAA